MGVLILLIFTIFVGIIFLLIIEEEEKVFHYDYDFKASTRMTTILRYIWKYRLKKYEAWIEEMANRYTQEIKYLWE